MREARAYGSALGRRRLHAAGEALRASPQRIAGHERRLVGALLVEKYAPAVALEATDVPSALEALLVRHPDLVVADLCLSGHSQGGFRLILDAASLGVPAVVMSGPISRTLEERLRELGVGWVLKGSSEDALFSAIDRVLAGRGRSRVEGESRPSASGPRMHPA